MIKLQYSYLFQERHASKTSTLCENGIKSSETETLKETSHEPVESVKTFQPLQPFKPFATFEAPKPFESLKSFELVKQVEDSFLQVQDSGGELPEGYEPVKALSPLQPYELEPIFSTLSESSPCSFHAQKTSASCQAEIKEENIKNTLKEIILDLDNFVERDKELKESREEHNNSGTHIPTLLVNGGPAYSNSTINQVSNSLKY